MILRLCVPVLCLAFLLPAVAAAADDAPATRDDGVRLFLQGDLEGAKRALAALTAEDPGDAASQAWLAETLRRLGDRDAARSAAEAALAADSCQALAHNVMGELLFPIRGGVEESEDTYDRALDQLLAAAACDSDDGNPWLSVWVEALRRGDRDLELKSLRRLHETGFFTPTALAFTRWMFGGLPRDAVILTNGDMDTYPMVMLQATEGFRTDVAVVNYSLLNTDWYPRLVSLRFGLPLPEKEPEVHRDADGNLVLKARQIVTFWLENLDRLKRPFTAGVTVSEQGFTPDYPAHLQLAGGFYRYLAEPASDPLDGPAVEASLGGLDLQAFSGPTVSAGDRSPVRRAGNDRLLDNIVAAALRCGVADFQSEDYERARTMALWAESFDAATPGPMPAIFAQTIEALKAGKPPAGEEGGGNEPGGQEGPDGQDHQGDPDGGGGRN